MAALPPLVETQGYPRRLYHERYVQSILNQFSNLFLLSASLSHFKILLKYPPDFRPCPMEQDTLICLRKVKKENNARTHDVILSLIRSLSVLA